MGDVLYDLAVDVLCELYRSLRSAGWAYAATFAGECDKEGVFAPVAIHPRSTVSENSAIEVFVEGLHDLIP